jgi:hypothetical protein
MARRAVPGIFCLEGDWKPDLARHDSVQPLLQLVEDVAGVRYIRRDAATSEELRHLLERWCEQQYERYPIGYLAFHGSPGFLHLRRRKVSLEELGEMLDGACARKILYFGSCGVLNVTPERIDAFRRRTKASCVAGFDEKLYWIESAAFDLLFFEALSYFDKMPQVDTWMQREHASFCRTLGVKMYY